MTYTYILERICSHMNQLKDLTKEPPFGLLTVVAHSHRNASYKHFWKCQCQCGVTKIIQGSTLLSGRAVSCGCLKKRRGKDNPCWTGCGELSGEFISSIKANARKKKIPFLVSKEYLWELYQKQGGKCALTGISLSLEDPRYSDPYARTASLDRIDSTKGYVEGNVQWVHKTINSMKMDLSESDFLKWCRTVVEHTRK